ncbi:hypothetical protein N483_14070 [Pseudoalteromonas luteoviolacea NCIMB 1944]|nr:hypothetical protein N483_14070 [Pseudoalteromonas luteoviolacea NCIMB 1944]
MESYYGMSSFTLGIMIMLGVLRLIAKECMAVKRQ